MFGSEEWSEISFKYDQKSSFQEKKISSENFLFLRSDFLQERKDTIL